MIDQERDRAELERVTERLSSAGIVAPLLPTPLLRMTLRLRWIRLKYRLFGLGKTWTNP